MGFELPPIDDVETSGQKWLDRAAFEAGASPGRFPWTIFVPGAYGDVLQRLTERANQIEAENIREAKAATE